MADTNLSSSSLRSLSPSGVNTSEPTTFQANVEAFQHVDRNMYYRTIREIKAGEELTLFDGEEYALRHGIVSAGGVGAAGLALARNIGQGRGISPAGKTRYRGAGRAGVTRGRGGVKAEVTFGSTGNEGTWRSRSGVRAEVNFGSTGSEGIARSRGSVTRGRGSVRAEVTSGTTGNEGTVRGRGGVSQGRGGVRRGRGSVNRGCGGVSQGRGGVTRGRPRGRPRLVPRPAPLPRSTPLGGCFAQDWNTYRSGVIAEAQAARARRAAHGTTVEENSGEGWAETERLPELSVLLSQLPRRQSGSGSSFRNTRSDLDRDIIAEAQACPAQGRSTPAAGAEVSSENHVIKQEPDSDDTESCIGDENHPDQSENEEDERCFEEVKCHDQLESEEDGSDHLEELENEAGDDAVPEALLRLYDIVGTKQEVWECEKDATEIEGRGSRRDMDEEARGSDGQTREEKRSNTCKETRGKSDTPSGSGSVSEEEIGRTQPIMIAPRVEPPTALSVSSVD